MRQSLWSGSLLVTIPVSLLACAGGESVSPRELIHHRGVDPSVTAPIEKAAPEAGESPRSAGVGYPAPHPPMPQIPTHGGEVLHDPVIVSVTFPGDELADRIAAFGEEVGGLDWWRAAVSPYGAGPSRSGGHVAVREAPGSSLSDSDVEDWLVKKLDDGTLPPPTDQSLYTLYYPASTTVTFEDGSGSAASCQTFLGYHSAVVYKDLRVAYAVINRCGDLDQVTETASHEFAEAASDPHPLTTDSLGYMLLASNAWTLLGGENADMCAGVSGVTEKGWALTRVWNNENAAAGQQPCLPVVNDGAPFFNAGIVKDTMSASAGTTVTTEVQCYSFGPLPNPMSLEIQTTGRTGLRFALDRKSCRNGDKVTMSITVPAGARRGTDYHYSLIARLNEDSAHLWRGMVHVR